MVLSRGRFSCVLALALLALSAIRVSAEEGKDEKHVDLKAQAAKVWQRNCQKCHTVPDPKFETDRGFLAQLMETS